MDTLERMRKLQEDRGWSDYRVAKESGLSESTIANIYRRNALPSIPTLEAICKGFGITVSQFFAEGELVEVTPDLQEVFVLWRSLGEQQRQAVVTMMKAMKAAQSE